jgi:RNA polymerase sigma-70 factor, ECF subfamily
VGAVVDATAPSADAGELAGPDGFRAFYADALPRVYGYFYHRCGGDAALAEDLTQETFLAAVAALKRGTPVAAPVPWLLGIARHKLLDHFRRQRRQGWTVLPWDDAADDAADDAELAAPAADEAARERVVAALAAVPAPQREALVLRYLDGLAVPEVAAALGRSVAAVESLLARGRAGFRRGYREAGDGG